MTKKLSDLQKEYNKLIIVQMKIRELSDKKYYIIERIKSKNNKDQLCPGTCEIPGNYPEFATEHYWEYFDKADVDKDGFPIGDVNHAECIHCHIKSNFKIDELIHDEFGDLLPMDHKNIKDELENWHDYYGSFGNCECSISDLLEGEDYKLEDHDDNENDDFLWELWIEREAFYCGNMKHTDVEYHVVHKIMNDIEETRKKLKLKNKKRKKSKSRKK